jgi:hypothetical protein
MSRVPHFDTTFSPCYDCGTRLKENQPLLFIENEIF